MEEKPKNKLVDWIVNKSYAYKTMIIVIVLSIAAGLYLIIPILTEPKPDYTVIIATKDKELNSLQYTTMEKYMETYAEDLNHDGKVMIRVDYCYLNTDYNPNAYAAEAYRLGAQLGLSNWSILIADQSVYDQYSQQGIGFEDLPSQPAGTKTWKWNGSKLFEEVNKEFLINGDLLFTMRTISKASSDPKAANVVANDRKLMENIMGGIKTH